MFLAMSTHTKEDLAAEPREDAVHFGFSRVAEREKASLVRAVFDSVAPRYDLMNDLMSGGLHRVWKDAMVSFLAPPKTAASNWRLLDVAGGDVDDAETSVGQGHTVAGKVPRFIGAAMFQRVKHRSQHRAIVGIGPAEGDETTDATHDLYEPPAQKAASLPRIDTIFSCTYAPPLSLSSKST